MESSASCRQHALLAFAPQEFRYDMSNFSTEDVPEQAFLQRQNQPCTYLTH